MSCPDAVTFFQMPTPNKRLADDAIMSLGEKYLHGKCSSIILSGPKYEQHIQDHFVRFGTDHLKIVEMDPKVYSLLFEKASKCTFYKAGRVLIVNEAAEKASYYFKHIVDLDLMDTWKTTGPMVRRALKEQMDSVGKRNKLFIFSMAIRASGGYIFCFDFINKLLKSIGCELKGFDGKDKTFGKGELIDCQGERLFCHTHEPNYKKGGRVKEIGCYTYRDQDHAAMMTTAIAYK
jgi:hypothetical protein